MRITKALINRTTDAKTLELLLESVTYKMVGIMLKYDDLLKMHENNEQYNLLSIKAEDIMEKLQQMDAVTSDCGTKFTSLDVGDYLC